MKYLISFLLLAISLTNYGQLPAYDGTSIDDYLNYLSLAEVDQLLEIEDVSPQLDLEGRKPLLLIHGWSFNGRPAPPGGGYWDHLKNYILNDPELRANFKPYYVKYWSNYVPIPTLSEALRDQVEALGLHEKKLIVMGHSMGGLVAKSFINEQQFTKGISKNKKCGENVDLMLTLSSPHHGSPMANGPARNAKVSFFLKTTMNLVEAFVFNETDYDQVNRSDLLWDNYDNLFDYETFSDEQNQWLVNLNKSTTFDPKTICYSGSVDGVFLIPEDGNLTEQYQLGAWFMEQGFNFENDGIVPIQSAQFEGHDVKRVRHFNAYNHADIIRGKENKKELFDVIKTDLKPEFPLKMKWPVAQNTYLKHSQNRKIQWVAPESIKKVNLYFSQDGGETYSSIATNINATEGEFMWNVPDINSSECLIKIEDADFKNTFTISTHTFTIFHNRITVRLVDNSKYMVRYRNNTIEWTQEGLGNFVKITYIDPDNAIEKVIANNLMTQAGSNQFVWTSDASLPPTANATLEVELQNLENDFGDTEVYSFQSGTFSMLGDPEFTILSPETYPKDYIGISGEELVIGDTYAIKWQASGEIKYLEFFLCNQQKNVIKSLTTDNCNPGIDITKSSRFHIPDLIGNTYYFKVKAGYSKDSILVESFSENSFRINYQTSITSPMPEEFMSIYPCFEATAFGSPSKYEFILEDTLLNDDNNHRGWNYISTTGDFCIPQKERNELIPGQTYRLTGIAYYDSLTSFLDQVLFKTDTITPWTFEILNPIDSTERSFWEIYWTRAVAAQGYHIKTQQGNNLLQEINLTSSNDTTAILLFEDAEFYEPITVVITAYNNYGATIVSKSFYKKYKTSIETTNQNNLNLRCFPNPISEQLTIEFSIGLSQEKQPYACNLIDINGHIVANLSKGITSRGINQIQWIKSENTPPGNYLIQLKIGDRIQTMKLQVR